jgi:hypothetical protein
VGLPLQLTTAAQGVMRMGMVNFVRLAFTFRHLKKLKFTGISE